MNQLSDWFYCISKGWVAIVAVGVFLLFCLFALPGQNRLSNEYSQGMGSPDTSFTYSSKRLYQMAEFYGEEGRIQYLHARWTFDVAFPLIYTFFLTTSISWLFKRSFALSSAWRMANLLPLAAMAADFLENSMTSLVFAQYPFHSLIGGMLAPLFTPLKWLLIFVSFGVLVIGFFITTLRYLTKG
jgi:hypothetical protein